VRAESGWDGGEVPTFGGRARRHKGARRRVADGFPPRVRDARAVPRAAACCHVALAPIARTGG